VPAWAALLPDAEVARVDRLMARKYRVDLLFIEPFRTVQAALHRRRPAGHRLAWRSRRCDHWRQPGPGRLITGLLPAQTGQDPGRWASAISAAQALISFQSRKSPSGPAAPPSWPDRGS
jgi:hypothetical protein